MSWDDWDDSEHPFDTIGRVKPTLCVDNTTDGFTVRVCSRGHEKRGENLGLVHRKNGRVEYLCVKCHRKRQRDYHARQRAQRQDAA